MLLVVGDSFRSKFEKKIIMLKVPNLKEYIIFKKEHILFKNMEGYFIFYFLFLIFDIIIRLKIKILKIIIKKVKKSLIPNNQILINAITIKN